MAKSAHAKRSSSPFFEKEAERTAKDERAIQRKVDRSDQKKSTEESGGGAMQAGARVYPVPPLPDQHLRKPGHEADLELKPMYDAPHYKGSEKLQDKVALITGGDSGIGRAVAVLFAREGADVAVAYLDEHEDAEETKRAVEKEGRRCILLSGDVADAEFCKDAVERTVEELGKLDILVNNAAFQEHVNSFEELTDEHFDRTIKTNLYGYFYMAQGGGAAYEIRQRHRHDRLGHRPARQQGPARLFDDQGRHPCLHPLARHASHRPRHPRERRRARAGLDAAQPGRQSGREGRQVRRRHADEAAGAARRDRAGLRVPRGAVLLQLHHRRGAAHHRRLFRRLTFKRMRILLTNDDGIEAPGLGVLEKIATDLTDDVWVVAPETDNSGASHSLTLAEPLRMRELGKRHYAVKGTPTDCVIMGVRFLLRDQPPDLVLSGVNRGQNLADDVTYSGTVAGAIQGTLLGVPSDRHESRLRAGGDRKGGAPAADLGDADAAWRRAACASCSMSGWPEGVVINVNFPNCEPGAVKGPRRRVQGQRDPGLLRIEDRFDTRGRAYYWVGIERRRAEPPEGTDLWAVRSNLISVTPLCLDYTDQKRAKAIGKRSRSSQRRLGQRSSAG